MTLGLLGFAMALPGKAIGADKARASGFTDIFFGEVGVSGGDVTAQRELCIYSNSSSAQYSVMVTGSRSADDLVLSSSNNNIALEIQWADQAGQSSGRILRPNVFESGFTTNAQNQGCKSGPAATATLIVNLRGSELGKAKAGSYAGWLAVTVSPL
ncbi:hypothetical protein P7228_09140 [Altererythrobacter arenosus]|uniref:Spore coat protein U domain-containing protein n=1 Tax=Altererythrobacter arenosus TaxID=3032592 RepID=A0ABY8FPG8_9SPHN|nr:hypothetical protein [Altererythrobacter sp. CAU 1644]WFL76165.1 hypothetical protein P7228_09140 [Altererythrobacter sp. CAU 1644]